MSNYHDKTLELLRSEPLWVHFPAHNLRNWANSNKVILPAAFLEWAELNGQQLLSKYSNDDWFSFDRPRILTTPEGLRGILFYEENQGNFRKLVLLDRGDDPPVLFSWIGQPPWVVHTESFSDCVFAQIFDWQYWLEFYPDGPDYKEITYTGDIDLKTDRCLSILRERFTEEVSTRYIVDECEFRDYRFSKSLEERITVIVGNLSEDYEDCKASIQITGKYELVVE